MLKFILTAEGNIQQTVTRLPLPLFEQELVEKDEIGLTGGVPLYCCKINFVLQ